MPSAPRKPRTRPPTGRRAEADALHRLGRDEEALAEQARELARQVGSRIGQAAALQAQSEALLSVALAAGDADQADVAAGAASDARQLFTECGMPGMAEYDCIDPLDEQAFPVTGTQP